MCAWDSSPRSCSGLRLDLAASTAGQCQRRCCADTGCQHWQFGVGETGCYRGVPLDCTSLVGFSGPVSSGVKIMDANASSAVPPPLVDGLGIIPTLGTPNTNASVGAGDAAGGALVSEAGLQMEIIIIGVSGGVVLLLCLFGFWCYYGSHYEKLVRNEKTVHPRTTGRMRAGNLYAASEGPRTHTMPQLSAQLRADLAMQAARHAARVVPFEDAEPTTPNDVVVSDLLDERMEACSWGTWAPAAAEPETRVEETAPLDEPPPPSAPPSAPPQPRPPAGPQTGPQTQRRRTDRVQPKPTDPRATKPGAPNSVSAIANSLADDANVRAEQRRRRPAEPRPEEQYAMYADERFDDAPPPKPYPSHDPSHDPSPPSSSTGRGTPVKKAASSFLVRKD